MPEMTHQHLSTVVDTTATYLGTVSSPDLSFVIRLSTHATSLTALSQASCVAPVAISFHHMSERSTTNMPFRPGATNAPHGPEPEGMRLPATSRERHSGCIAAHHFCQSEAYTSSLEMSGILVMTRLLIRIQFAMAGGRESVGNDFG